MNDLNMHPLQAILTWCAEAAPNPWYPSKFAQASGIPRAQLDPHLDELRLGGLIRLTDWVQGHGQGYTLTPAGEEVVRTPRLMEKIRTTGVVPTPAAPALTPARAGLNTSHWDRGEIVRGALLNPVRPVVTFAIMFANVLVFLAGMALVIQEQRPLNKYIAGSDLETPNATGSVNVYQVLDGDWWRLLTACFVHIGLLHLGVNMYALYVFGPLVERLFGHWRYLLLYLIAGFGASCVGVLFQFASVLAGASGAICGLLGAFAVWTFLNRRFLPPQLVSSWTRNVVINTVLIAVVSAAVPGISWSGHLGGAVFGILAAALLNYQMTGKGVLRWLALVGALLLPLASYAVLSRGQDFNATYAAIVSRYASDRFNERVLRTCNRIRKESGEEGALEWGTLLVAQATGRRDENEVEKALALLKKTIATLPKAVAQARAEGPFQDTYVEKARLALLDFLEQEITLFERFQECLESGKNWTKEKMAQLERQQEKVKEATRYWKTFLKSS